MGIEQSDLASKSVQDLAAVLHYVYTACATNGISEKSLRNLRKHGISFEVAALAFEDEYCLVGFDHIDEAGEQRWHAIGMIRIERGTPIVILVVHAYRENRHGEEIIRIISARAAEKHEIRRYQEQAMD